MSIRLSHPLRAALLLLPAAALLLFPGAHASADPLPGGPAAALLQETAMPDTAAGLQSGSIHGQVVNGTDAGTPLQGLQITLSAYNVEGLQFTGTSTADSSGAFSFADIALDPEMVYLAGTEYDGIRYSSMPAQAAAGESELFLQLIVYESTPETGALSISRAHLAFDFLEEDAIRVGELWVLYNAGSRTIAPPDGLAVTLPDGFRDLEVDPAYEAVVQPTDTGFVFSGPLLPGEDAGSLLFSYSLPYSSGLALTRSFPLPLQGGTLMLPAEGVTLQGTNLVSDGILTMAQTSMQSFNFPALAAGEPLAVQISGTPPGTGLITLSDTTSTISAAVLLLLSIIFLRFTLNRRTKAADGPRAELIRRLARLDAAFESGSLPPDEYRSRRTALKAAVRSVSGKKHDQG